jgi:hypothetical protein
VRLNFSLPSEARRPKLMKGRIAANPHDPGQAALQLNFLVAVDGSVHDILAVNTQPVSGAKDGIQEVEQWRFLPAMVDGHPIDAKAVLEIKRGGTRLMPRSFPRLRTGTGSGTAVSINPSDPIDFSLAAPKLISPVDGAVFDTYPRRTSCVWDLHRIRIQ